MSDCLKIVLKNEIAELEKLSLELEQFGAANDIPPKVMFQVNLALDEIVTNIISYGYADGLEHEFAIDISVSTNKLFIIVSDDGITFNPLTVPAPDMDLAPEDRKIGGLGIHLARKVMDEMDYERRGCWNVLKMIKTITD